MPATPRRRRGTVSAGFVGRQNSALNPSSCDTWVRVGTGAEGGHQIFPGGYCGNSVPSSEPSGGVLPGCPEVRKAEALSLLALSLGKQEYTESIFHSQKHLQAPEQMPHTPNSISSGKCLCCPSRQGAHGQLHPMSYLVFVGTQQQRGAQKSLGFSVRRR